MSSHILDLPRELKKLLGPRDPFGIYHINIPSLPQLAFEWHPISRRVFFIRKCDPKKGVPLADGIATKDEANHAVLYWARGYLEGLVDGKPKEG
jgi:hypothetical protein